MGRGEPVTRPVSASNGTVSRLNVMSMAVYAISLPSRDTDGCQSLPRPTVSARGGPDTLPSRSENGKIHSELFLPSSRLLYTIPSDSASHAGCQPFAIRVAAPPPVGTA